MISAPPCLLYTADGILARRVRAYATFVDVTHIEQGPELKRALEQHNPALLLFDVRGSNGIGLLQDVRHHWSDTLVIAFGVSRSDPVFQALDLGVYAEQDLNFDGSSLESLLRQAVNHLILSEELRILRSNRDSAYPADPVRTGLSPRGEPALSLRQFVQPLRHFDNVEELLQGIIDGIASTAVVLRAGIFASLDNSNIYRLGAGIGCLDETRAMELTRDDPFVRWLEINAQLISRSAMTHVTSMPDRMLLQRMLDNLGAELIIPLTGRSQMLGWLFVGRRATGGSFEQTDLQDVMMLAEHVSTSLENARLYREVAQQKAFAETLLHSLPTGVIAVDADGRVDWFNDAAEKILQLGRAEVMTKPVKVLGTLMADRIHHALRGTANWNDVQEWQDPETQRYLSLRTARLLQGDRCWGAVAFIYDRTREEMLNRRQQELDRTAFWTELAASMSHEIRNPMVAIKTFAQLLPERFNEPEFRIEFSSLMSREVDRLDAIIQQINSFANLPQLELESMDIRDAIEEGCKQASMRVFVCDPSIDMELNEPLPKIRGDRRALSDCFAHIFANAMEALGNIEEPKITLVATSAMAGDEATGINITLSDNAGGINPEIRDNVFSPFCTTKARPMGLGLAIVQRTIADHGGHVFMEDTTDGTCVRITLPTTQQEEVTA